MASTPTKTQVIGAAMTSNTMKETMTEQWVNSGIGALIGAMIAWLASSFSHVKKTQFEALQAQVNSLKEAMAERVTRNDMRTEIASLKADLKEDLAALREEIRGWRRS